MAPEACLSFSSLVVLQQSPLEKQIDGLSLEVQMAHETNPVPFREPASHVSKRQRTSEAYWINSSSFSSTASSSRSCGSEEASPVFPEACGALSDHVAVASPVLGSGQFGQVRECTDLESGASLAVKSINKRTADLGEVRTEVQVMKRLQGCPGVVQLSRVVEEPDSVHLVMDLCRGGDLFDEVVRRERFAERDAALIFSELVAAVAFCHSRGVMHRDLKPENILLTRCLDPHEPLAEQAARGPITKLADFGLATTMTPWDPVTGVAGSPFYIAPEVLSGEYNSKADVWSLGVILYVLLSGMHPFWGPSDGHVYEAIRKDDPDFAWWPWKDISCEAKQLVEMMLHKDPSRRPSAESVLQHRWLAQC